MECNHDITNAIKFPDGRTFCPNSIINNGEASNGYRVTCKCDTNTEGCTNDIYVFTDAVEATRDFFFGKTCKANNITITTQKI